MFIIGKSHFHDVKRYLHFEKAVGKKIRELREEKGLSQEDLAELLRIHQHQVSRLENATYYLKISDIISVAHALGYEPKVFFEIPITDNS